MDNFKDSNIFLCLYFIALKILGYLTYPFLFVNFYKQNNQVHEALSDFLMKKTGIFDFR